MFRKTMFGLAATLLLAATASAQTVDEIVAKHIAARGGMAKLKAVKTMRITGKREFGPGLNVPIVVEQSRPNKMRADFTVQGMTGTLAYDGAAGWQVMPFQGNPNPEPMNADDVKDFSEDSDIDGALVDWKEKGHVVELVGKEAVEGTDAYKLKVTKKGGGVTHLFLDADSFLELKSETKRTVRGTEQEVVAVSGDYKDVGGLMMAHSFQFGAKGGQMLSMTFEKVEINVPVEDSRFKMPAVQKKADANAPAAKPENKEAETKPADKKPAEAAKPPVKPPVS